MSEDIVKKRGRPSGGGRKRDSGLNVKTTTEVKEMLDFICEKNDKNKTQAIEALIKNQYMLTKSGIKMPN